MVKPVLSMGLDTVVTQPMITMVSRPIIEIIYIIISKTQINTDRFLNMRCKYNSPNRQVTSIVTKICTQYIISSYFKIGINQVDCFYKYWQHRTLNKGNLQFVCTFVIEKDCEAGHLGHQLLMHFCLFYHCRCEYFLKIMVIILDQLV